MEHKAFRTHFLLEVPHYISPIFLRALHEQGAANKGGLWDGETGKENVNWRGNTVQFLHILCNKQIEDFSLSIMSFDERESFCFFFFPQFRKCSLLRGLSWPPSFRSQENTHLL